MTGLDAFHVYVNMPEREGFCAAMFLPFHNACFVPKFNDAHVC
jgi:hypothetical protein